MLKLSLASRARDYRSAANGRRRARDPARMILFDDDIEEANELYIYIYIYIKRDIEIVLFVGNFRTLGNEQGESCKGLMGGRIGGRGRSVPR